MNVLRNSTGLLLMMLASAGIVCSGCSDENKVDENGYFPDLDKDGVADAEDNCVDVANPGQADADGDSVGDACETNAVFEPTFQVLKADPANMSPGVNLFSVIGGKDVFFNEDWAEFGFLAVVSNTPATADSGFLNPLWTFANFSGGYFNMVDVMPNGHIIGVRGQEGGAQLVEIDPVTATTIRVYDDVMYNHDVIALPDGNLLTIWSDEGPFEGLDGGNVQFEIVRVMDINGVVQWEWSVMENVPDAPYSKTYVSLTGLWSNCNAIDFTPKADWTEGTALRGDIYLECRLHNRVYRIDYPSGDLLWTMGDAGDFGEGMFYHPHDAQVTYDVDDTGARTHTRVLLYDNREGPTLGSASPCPPDETCPASIEPYSRVIEVLVDNATLDAEIVWKWPSPTQTDFGDYAVYSAIAGGVSRLDNGNLLITHASVGGNPYIAEVVHGRVIEVQRDGTLSGANVVWDMIFNDNYGSFKAIRIPESATTNWTSLPIDPNDIPAED